MATELQNLIAARGQIADRILELTAQSLPDTSIDGESVSWASYLNTLISQRDELDKQILKLRGPFLVRSYGR